jgi:hypothetical protein
MRSGRRRSIDQCLLEYAGVQCGMAEFPAGEIGRALSPVGCLTAPGRRGALSGGLEGAAPGRGRVPAEDEGRDGGVGWVGWRS